jgi:tRNA(Ile)-lysidine synthase
MDFAGKIRKWIRKHDLIRTGDSITAAVSGGPDSMAMLTVLNELSGSMEIGISAAHFNHNIRPESEKEAEMVSDYCRKLNIPLFRGSSDVPAEAANTGGGMEETARELRYSFLEEAAVHFGADSVSTGHNRNDQAETVLHHIIRGSGPAGLAGIPPRRGIFIRPLLCCSREEIENYIKETGIPYALDRSNLDTGYLRNRIRNELIPELATGYNPSITESLARLAENISELTAPARMKVEGFLDMEPIHNAVSVPLEKLERLNDFEIYMFTDTALRKYFGIHQDILKCHFDAVKSLIRESCSGKRVILPHGITIAREQLFLRISAAGETEPVPEAVEIPGEGEYTLPGFHSKLIISRVSAAAAESFRSTESAAYLGSIEFPLIIRTRRDGDRLQPFGMEGTRKISDLLIDRKVPLHRRDRLPVIEDAGGIVWIPGVATDERTRVKGIEEEVVRILIEKDI